jgi:uncharacterized protein YtpQ (UPF0354 family)
MTEDSASMDNLQATVPAPPISLTAEHSWEAAAPLLYPVLRPLGTTGLALDDVANPHHAAAHVEPLVDRGPADLVIAYVMAVGEFDVLANGDHLAAWGASPAELRDAAFRNLAAWSLEAPWSEDAADQRRVLSSDTGDGWDASRILLPEVKAHLERELGGPGSRVLVGVPAAHLLVAASLRPEDVEFAALFADFVLEYAGDSDAEIDRRIFELRDGLLSVFRPAG